MPVEFYIPKLGQTVEEVTLIKWLVEDGTKVKRGQELLEVETDKAIFPVEANGKGTLHIGPYSAGQVVPVLTVVAIIGEENESFSAQQGTAVVKATSESMEKVNPVELIAESEANEEVAVGVNEGRIFSSPRARKTAKEMNIDVNLVPPTGAEGLRVVEADVLSYKTNMPKITPVAKNIAEQAGFAWMALQGSGVDGKITKDDVANAMVKTETENLPKIEQSAGSDIHASIPLTGVRKVIAERMSQSVHTTARVTLVMEVDATEFVKARNRLRDRYAKEWGFAPGYNDLLAKVVAISLRKFPYMNARLTQTAIEHIAAVNVAMAVDTERGLLVPVIRNADQKSLQAFGSEFRTMVDRARAGRALPDDLSGGTFTITNLGMYDVDAFTPVINLPEAAILGVGRIAPKPVVVNGEIVVRDMWTLSLVFDHRLVDGAPAAKFLQYIKQVIEDPFLLLV